MKKREAIRKILLTALPAFFAYALLEAFFSYHYLTQPIDPLLLYEDAGKTIQFDPTLGYRLTTTPSRWAQWSQGTLEFQSVMQGNPQGFPDRDAFTPRRQDAKPRFAVFGDSFSAGQFLSINWPDQIEKTLDHEANFLNFSLDGGGLANWWHTLEALVSEGYEFDYVIFAVSTGDLYRTFTFSDLRGQSKLRLGRIPSWNKNDYPKALQEAHKYMPELDAYNVSSQQFELALQGKWRPVPDRKFRFELASQIRNRLHRRNTTEPVLSTPQLLLIKEMAAYLKEHNLKPIVFHIPLREELIHEKFKWGSRHSRQFTRLLEGTFIDGTTAFKALTPEQIKQHWLPHDGHWNQKGSDLFASFVIQSLNNRSLLKIPPILRASIN